LLSFESAENSIQWQDAVFLHLYIPRMAHFTAANDAYSRFLPAINPPARATVQLADNPESAMVVEVLYAPRDLRTEKKVLHVQSISEWAPSCIGPYSQAVDLRGFTHFAGQIPLDPPTMAVIQGDVIAQTTRSLRSCQSVAIAMRTDLPKSMLWCTVYTSSSAGQRGRQDAERALRSFLQQGTEIEAPERDNYETPEAEMRNHQEEDRGADGDRHVDFYLAPPDLTRHWDPLITFIEVPELPRGVTVEIQPVAWSQTLSVTPSSSSGSSRSGESDEGSGKDDANRHRRCGGSGSGDPRLPGWVRHIKRSESTRNVTHGQIDLACVASYGSFMRLHAFYTTTVKLAAGIVESGLRRLADFTQEELTAAGLASSDIEVAKILISNGAWNGNEAVLQEVQSVVADSLFCLAKGPSAIVHVVSMGWNAAAEADIGIEIFARR